MVGPHLGKIMQKHHVIETQEFQWQWKSHSASAIELKYILVYFSYKKYIF
jgi:hypothetical protein